MLELENVGLEIPVLTTETRLLKSTLIRSVTGGRLSRSRGGAVVTALQDISRLFAKAGPIGHNGAGKSSFLRLVSGIYQHTSGHFKAHVPVFPMIHKGFITSPELSVFRRLRPTTYWYMAIFAALRSFATM